MSTQRQRSRNVCTQDSGAFGLCCNPATGVSASNRVFTNADEQGFSVRSVASGDKRTAQRNADIASQEIENEIRDLNTLQKRDGGSYFHGKFQKPARRSTRREGVAGTKINQLCLKLVEEQRGQRIRQGRDASAINFGPAGRSFQNGCPECSPMRCSSNRKYRTADGSCNNAQDGRLGKTNTVFNRLELPDYSDGVLALRRDTFGNDLPSPRLVSTEWTKISENLPDNRFTTMLMAMGQFIDHDLAHSPVFVKINNEEIDCCPSNRFNPLQSNSSVCATIGIPSNDKFFSGSNRKTCMNFVRTMTGCPLDCSIRYREQINQVSHFLDLSQVYGSTEEEVENLRTKRGGRMRTGPGPDGPLLPDEDGKKKDECKVGVCMKAGDSRVNEVPNLSLLHTIFMREHNRIAENIARSEGGGDEQIFQETRRVLIAKYQHIVYNEWLPVVLGQQYMNRYGLKTLGDGYSNSYKSNIDPRITNEFATAAFRFGHTLIPGILKVFASVSSQLDPNMNLQSTFDKPQLLRLSGMIDGLVRGMTRTNSQRVDATFPEDITNNLFDVGKKGMDLIALNIQRGRDHGLAGYTKYRELCGLGRANNFNDLRNQMDQFKIDDLRRIYTNVDDIDLFVGMLSERPQNDSILGVTALCIIGDQFSRLRQGDRYFYDLANSPGSFSSSELEKIRESSFARILCDNSNVGDMQPLAFQVPDTTNPVQSCSNENAIP